MSISWRVLKSSSVNWAKSFAVCSLLGMPTALAIAMNVGVSAAYLAIIGPRAESNISPIMCRPGAFWIRRFVLATPFSTDVANRIDPRIA